MQFEVVALVLAVAACGRSAMPAAPVPRPQVKLEGCSGLCARLASCGLTQDRELCEVDCVGLDFNVATNRASRSCDELRAESETADPSDDATCSVGQPTFGCACVGGDATCSGEQLCCANGRVAAGKRGRCRDSSTCVIGQ